MHEGGISTPLIVHWPKGIKSKNELRKQPAHIIDIMATSLELAQIDYPETFNDHTLKPLDGRSLVPIIFKDQKIRDTLFWEHQGNKAVRVGDMKLVSIFEKNTWELYDMANDRTETNDLAEAYPEKVKDLELIYNKWAANSNVIPWEEMNINVIAGKESPLARPREEADKAYNEVQEQLKRIKN